MSCVALIGLMGSGKSTVGALIAARTGARFVDVDEVIEARTGRTVRALWEEGGEDAYRRLESEACLDAIAAGTAADGGHIVLAAPGGAVLDPTVRAALGRCTVIWLRADPAVLGERVRVGDHRPLLDEDPADVLTVMAEDRTPVYASLADRIVDADRESAEALAASIIVTLAATPGDTDPPPEPH